MVFFFPPATNRTGKRPAAHRNTDAEATLSRADADPKTSSALRH